MAEAGRLLWIHMSTYLGEGLAAVRAVQPALVAADIGLSGPTHGAPLGSPAVAAQKRVSAGTRRAHELRTHCEPTPRRRCRSDARLNVSTGRNT